MAYTFIDGINRVLKRVGVIQGDAGDLTDFTESSKQIDIDVAIQVWNEMLHELYSRNLFKGEAAEGSITLVTGTTTATDYLAPREYALASDFERMSGKKYGTRILYNESNGHKLTEYPGGYDQLKADRPLATDYVGTPRHWVINPIRGGIELDTNPGSGDSGDVYKYLYDKRLALTATGDTFPFSDTVVDALVPSVSQLWKRDRNNQFDGDIFRVSFNRAVEYLTQGQSRKRYGK